MGCCLKPHSGDPPSLLPVRANLIPSPPTFNSDYGYISWEAYANVSYYTRVLPPVPDDCPTPMGTKGTWLLRGTCILSVSHPAMDTSARHHWQCHVLSLSCPGWLCSRRSLMASRLLLGTAQAELLGHVTACVRGLQGVCADEAVPDAAADTTSSTSTSWVSTGHLPSTSILCREAAAPRPPAPGRKVPTEAEV